MLASLVACDALYPEAPVRDSPLDPESPAFAPQAPDRLLWALEGEAVRLRWRDNSAYEAGYLVERMVDSSGVWAERARLPAGAITFLDEEPIRGFIATYRVAALQAHAGAERQESRAEIVADRYGARDLDVRWTVRSDEAIVVRWEDPFPFEVTFDVERAIGGGAFEMIAEAVHADSALDRHRLQPEVPYRYRVRATYQGRRSPFARSPSVNVAVAPPPSLRLETVSAEAARLTWAPSPHARGYVLERRRGEEGFVPVAEVDASTRAYVDAGLDPAQVYQWRVRTLASVPTLSPEVRYVYVLRHERKLPPLADSWPRTIGWSWTPGGLLIRAEARGSLYYYSAETGAQEGQLSLKQEIHAFAAGSERVALGTSDGIQIRDAHTGALVCTIAAPSQRAIAMLGDDAVVTGNLQIVDVCTAEVIRSLPLRREAVERVWADPTGKQVAVRYSSGRRGLVLHDAVSGSVIRVLQGAHVAYGPSGAQLVVYPGYFGFELRQAADGALVRSLLPPELGLRRVQGFGFTSDGGGLVVGQADRTLSVWTAGQTRPWHADVVLGLPVWNVLVEPDGPHVITLGGSGQEAHRWRAQREWAEVAP